MEFFCALKSANMKTTNTCDVVYPDETETPVLYRRTLTYTPSDFRGFHS
jgi:hypothetical protein